MLKLSRVLSLMVTRAVVESAKADPVVALELERSIYDELHKLHRSRPRLVTYAPRLALRRVLTDARAGARMNRRTSAPIATDRQLLRLATEH